MSKLTLFLLGDVGYLSRISFSLSVLKFVGAVLGLSKLFFLLIFDGGGYLSGEDGRGGRGGAEAAADRDGVGVLIGDGGGDGGGGGYLSGEDSVEDSFSAGDGIEPSFGNERMFLVYKEEEE